MGISKNILVSITGRTDADWQSKLLEIEKYKIKKIALFLEMFERKQRLEIYSALLNSRIREIPFVHARDDMEDPEEFNFLIKNFKTKYFNIHEEELGNLAGLESIHNKLLLELNYDNRLTKKADVEKIGGFCIDLSHFQASKDRKTKEYDYVMEYEGKKHLFIANHLNGYDPKRKNDMHWIKSLKDFDYLKTLPRFLFGKYIALETFNSIEEQLKFKKYLEKILE